MDGYVEKLGDIGKDDFERKDLKDTVLKELGVHTENISQLTEQRKVISRTDRKSQVRQCLDFCTADFWSSLTYESAEQKPKHCITPEGCSIK